MADGEKVLRVRSVGEAFIREVAPDGTMLWNQEVNDKGELYRAKFFPSLYDTTWLYGTGWWRPHRSTVTRERRDMAVTRATGLRMSGPGSSIQLTLLGILAERPTSGALPANRAPEDPPEERCASAISAPEAGPP